MAANDNDIPRPCTCTSPDVAHTTALHQRENDRYERERWMTRAGLLSGEPEYEDDQEAAERAWREGEPVLVITGWPARVHQHWREIVSWLRRGLA